MTEQATETNAAFNWLKLMGLSIGEEVLILPLAGQAGQGLQGTLVEIAVGPSGPLVVIIRQAEDKPRVSIPWDSILMITRPNAPPAPMAAEQNADSVNDLIEMAEKMGLEVPGEIRDMAASK